MKNNDSIFNIDQLNVLYIILILCFFVLPSLAHAKAMFKVSTRDSIYAIGYSVDVEFSSSNNTLSLSNIDLSVFEREFVVHDYNVNKYEDFINGKRTSIEKLMVRLFPRHPGILTIPSFKFARFTSKKFTIKVVDDFTSTIQIRTNATKKFYFQREAIYIYIDVFQKRKSISIDIQQLINKNFIISETHKSEYIVKRQGRDVTVERYSWIVLPLNSGKLFLNLPMVKTGGRRMYPSGKITINVKPLPSSLPTYIPIATQSIQSLGFNENPRWIDQLYFWTLQLTGNGISAESIEKLLKIQLIDNAKVSFYPRTYSVKRNENGENFITTITIPFKPHIAGNFHLQAITLPFINPVTGKLEHTMSQNETLIMKSPSQEKLKLVVSFIILLFVLLVPFIRFYRKYLYKAHFFICYILIESTKNPTDIRNILFKWSPYKCKLNIHTIQDWDENVVVRSGGNIVKQKIINLLNDICYGSQKNIQQKKLSIKQHIWNLI